MMKKLLAIVICLLLMVCASAETMPGVRLTASDFTATLDGESSASDLVVTLDAAEGLGVLSVVLGGETLGTAHTKLEPDGGMRLMLNGGDAFALSERYLEETTCAEIVNGALAQTIRAEGLYPLLSGFMAQLDAQESDQFELTPDQLPGWLLEVKEPAQMWLETFGGEISVTKISVKRDSLGYTLTADDEKFEAMTFRRSGERIMAMTITWGMSVTLYAAPDGSVELGANTGINWQEGYENTNTTLKYHVGDNGADYSIFHQYESRWTEPVEGCDNQYSKLNVNGTVDAQGLHTADVRYSRDAEVFPDLLIAFHVESGPMEVGDALSDRNQVKKIDRSFGSAAVSLRKAYRDFDKSMAALTAEPVLGDVLSGLESDPVAGVIWDAITP